MDVMLCLINGRTATLLLVPAAVALFSHQVRADPNGVLPDTAITP